MSNIPVSKNSAAKAVIVDEIRDKISRAQGVVLLDYRGLSVAEDNELRKACRAANVEYRVLKNTMVHRAAEALEIQGLTPHLEGPTAVAFSYDDPVSAAKVLSDFAEKAKKTQIKCGILGSEVIDTQMVEALAKLPSKEVLVAKLLGQLNAPISQFVSVLSGPARALACALNAIAQQKSA
nr:50S ribosomal protein L10 [Maliibacterium massiliense]